MNAVYAVIYDRDLNFLLGKRYDTPQTLFFLGGTYARENNRSRMDVLQEKIVEKTSFVLELIQEGDKYFLYDKVHMIELIPQNVFTSGPTTYIEFQSSDLLKPYDGLWRYKFQENQINIVNYIIELLQENVAPHISFINWLTYAVEYQGKYRASGQLKSILRKRALDNYQIDAAISYLEFLDIYVRYQNISVASIDQIRATDGLQNSQKEFFSISK
jgi:hypothetical protein